MSRQPLQVADIFRAHAPAWRRTRAGHLNLGQLKTMSAIERCRTAALGGHVMRCEACDQRQIAYNSCRNRHCPTCQGAAAKRWLAARQADLLPVDYYHVVFTLPAPIAEIAYYNKAVIYPLLFKAVAETLDSPSPPIPSTSVRKHRAHRSAAHLGLNDDPSPAPALHRARWRTLTRRATLDRLPPRVFLTPTRTLAPVPAFVS